MEFSVQEINKGHLSVEIESLLINIAGHDQHLKALLSEDLGISQKSKDLQHSKLKNEHTGSQGLIRRSSSVRLIRQN